MISQYEILGYVLVKLDRKGQMVLSFKFEDPFDLPTDENYVEVGLKTSSVTR